MEKVERERRKFSSNFVAVDGKNERIEIKQSFFAPSSPPVDVRVNLMLKNYVDARHHVAFHSLRRKNSSK
jgi:hypothetical protein